MPTGLPSDSGGDSSTSVHHKLEPRSESGPRARGAGLERLASEPGLIPKV